MAGFLRSAFDHVARRFGWRPTSAPEIGTAPLTNAQRAEAETFLAAIKGAPLDDAPRLIYADWLDEQGGRSERAKYIRESCAFRDRWLREGPGREDAPEDRLPPDWIAHWAAEFAAPELPFELQFRRGFPEALASGWIPDAGAINASCWPGLISWYLTNFQRDDLPRLRTLAASGALDHLVELRATRSSVNDDLVAFLAECPCFESLRFLGLESGDLPLASLQALLNAPFAPRLQTLWLRRLSLDDALLNELFASPRLERLTSLDLSANHLNESDVDRLIHSPLAAQLRCLELDGNDLNLAAVYKLIRWPGATNLKALSLGDCSLTDDAAVALAAAPNLASLVYLNLAENHISKTGRQALERSQILKAAKVILAGA